MSFAWKIDECAVHLGRLHVRGWCHDTESPIASVDVLLEGAAPHRLTGFGQPSPDVAAALDPRATHVRFDEWIAAVPKHLHQPFALKFITRDGRIHIGEDALANATEDDRYFHSWENFLQQLASQPKGAVLELGSRARSGMVRRDRIPPHLSYVGLDILPGPNVDVVGDAHELSRLFPNQRFVAAFSLSVFEHLAMPWKVAIELNRVLEPGGIVYTSTHQTWPLHEEPWDFWRFSHHSWKTLFNAATGFEVLEAVCGEPARIYPQRTSAATRDLHNSPAWLGSAAIARKTGETTLDWPVPLNAIAADMYPAGEEPPPR